MNDLEVVLAFCFLTGGFLYAGFRLWRMGRRIVRRRRVARELARIASVRAALPRVAPASAYAWRPRLVQPRQRVPHLVGREGHQGLSEESGLLSTALTAPQGGHTA